MLNQQDCQRLQQQVRPLSASWKSPLAPEALWPLCLSRDLLHARLLELSERFAPCGQPGVRAVSSPLFPGEWAELPAEWQAPHFCRIQRYLPRRACLIWEFGLSPLPVGSQLEFRLQAFVPLSLQTQLQAYFKQFGQALARALKQLEDPQPAWMRAQALPAAWQALPESGLRSAAEKQLALTGWIDPMPLARQAGVSLAEACAFLLERQLDGLLQAHWLGLEPDEGPVLGGWDLPAAENIWSKREAAGQTDSELSETLSPAEIGLRFGLAGTPSERRLSPLSADRIRCLLWPGQEQSLPIEQALSWCAISSGTGKIRIRPQAPESPPIELENGLPAKLTMAAGGKLRVRHTGDRLTALRFWAKGRAAGTLLSLLSCQQVLPLLLAAWPEGRIFEREGFFLGLAQPLPVPVLSWLQSYFQTHDGALLAQDAPLLCFDSSVAAIRCAEALLETLRRLHAAGLSDTPPRLALIRGLGRLYRQDPGLVLEGLLFEQLQRLLTHAKGFDLVLPAALLHEPSLGAPLRQARWQMMAFSSSVGELFQLRPL